jgi:hypothetical protein
MPNSAGTVTFDPQPLKVGADWHIVVTYPSGEKGHITGFRNEAEAKEWLAGKGCEVWLKARGFAK